MSVRHPDRLFGAEHNLLVDVVRTWKMIYSESVVDERPHECNNNSMMFLRNVMRCEHGLRLIARSIVIYRIVPCQCVIKETSYFLIQVYNMNAQLLHWFKKKITDLSEQWIASDTGRLLLTLRQHQLTYLNKVFTAGQFIHLLNREILVLQIPADS